MRVLLLEDNPTDSAIVRSLLSRQGMEVQWVTDFNRALQCVRENELDAVLCDLNLPGVHSAIELFRQFRSNGPNVALIAYSGGPPPEELDAADAFLSKDGANEKILNFVIRKAVQLRREITRLKSSPIE